jgi:hypothetical protein
VRAPGFIYFTNYPGGNNIPSGGTTTSRAIEAGGSGTPDALYVVTDNGEVVASGRYNGSGRFINRFDNLQIREHLYELRENASLPPTSVWKVIVLSADVLSIDSIKGSPSGVDIPHNGATLETSVVLTGKAAKGKKIDVLDGATLMGQPIADPATGIWTLTLTGLTPRDYNFNARADSQTSPVYKIRVNTLVDPAPISIAGRNVVNQASSFFAPTRWDPPGTVVTCTPIGGKAPYTFISANPLIASVTTSGEIRSEGNGVTELTVIDADGYSQKVSVKVSNVVLLAYKMAKLSEVVTWTRTLGGVAVTVNDPDFQLFLRKYALIRPAEPLILLAGQYIDRDGGGFAYDSSSIYNRGNGQFIDQLERDLLADRNVSAICFIKP